MLELVVVTLWVICGIITHGMSFGYWQKNWPELAEQHKKDNIITSIVLGLAGPIGLFLITFHIISHKLVGVFEVNGVKRDKFGFKLW